MRQNEKQYFTGPPKKPDSKEFSGLLLRIVLPSLLLSCFFLIVVSSAQATITANNAPPAPLPQEIVPGQWHSYSMVAHAMGGIDQRSYTNSLDAFMENYQKGFRLFEVDLITTSDGYLVACHDWDNMLEALICPDLGEPLFGQSWSYGQDVPFALFNRARIFGKYKPLSLRDIVLLMELYPDVYIITDTKYSSQATADFQAIVEACSDSPWLLDRFIPQFYDFEMYQRVMEVYAFPNIIFTLYQYWDSIEDAALFCSNNGIDTVAIAHARLNDEALAIFESYNIVVYAHTINDPALGHDLLSKGVRGLYTDYLPSDFGQSN